MTRDVLIETDSLNGEGWGSGLPKRTIDRIERKIVTGSEHTLGAAMPNPSTGVVTIPLSVAPLTAGDGTANVTVYDASGRLVAEMRRNVRGGTVSEIQLDGSGWTNGIYVVRVEIGNAKRC